MWQDFPRVSGWPSRPWACCTTSATRRSRTSWSGSTRSGSSSSMGPDAARDQRSTPPSPARRSSTSGRDCGSSTALPDECFRHLPRQIVRLILADRVGRRLDRLPAQHHRRAVRRRPPRLPDARRTPCRHRARQHRLAPPGGQSGAPPGVRRLADRLGGPRRSRRSRPCWCSAPSTTAGSSTTRPRWPPTRRLTRCAEGIFDLATSPPPEDGADGAARPSLRAVIPNLDYVGLGRPVRRTGQRYAATTSTSWPGCGRLERR